MSNRKSRETLAWELDHTKWDYSSSTDRSFLLTSVERMFAGVAWEIAPQHLTPITETESVSAPVGDSADFESHPPSGVRPRR